MYHAVKNIISGNYFKLIYKQDYIYIGFVIAMLICTRFLKIYTLNLYIKDETKAKLLISNCM
jgi:hypothetical protein